MNRVELQRVLKRFNGLRKLLGLHIRCAKKIPSVSVVRIDLDDALERIDRRLRIAGVLGQHPEAVPGIRILRILFQRIFQCNLGFVDLLQVQVSDTHIQPRDRKFGIGLRGLLELFQSLLEQLLVHVGDAEVIQARRLDGIRFRLGGQQAKGSKQRCDKGSRNSEIHLANDLTTERTSAAKPDDSRMSNWHGPKSPP